MRSLFLFFIFLTGSCSSLLSQNGLFRESDGRIYFVSEAPLEIIEAASNNLRGIVDTEDRSFAFSVDIISFEGFNSPLQRTHFNENYMETERYPRATFSGKFIEDIDFTREGTYEVRAKGLLDIHGQSVERIIKGTMIIGETGIRVDADFSVPLADHNIKIPTIVNQRIAEIIQVEVSCILEPAS